MFFQNIKYNNIDKHEDIFIVKPPTVPIYTQNEQSDAHDKDNIKFFHEMPTVY